MNIHNHKNERLERCRVYQVVYSVSGRGKLLARINACVIAMDVGDLVDEIKKTVLGAELNAIDDGYHEVAELVEIESAQLIGRLHGVTDTVHSIIVKCNDQEKGDPGDLTDQ